jgi:hypothetical protein
MPFFADSLVMRLTTCLRWTSALAISPPISPPIARPARALRSAPDILPVSGLVARGWFRTPDRGAEYLDGPPASARHQSQSLAPHAGEA